MTAMGTMILFCWLPISHKFQQSEEAI